MRDDADHSPSLHLPISAMTPHPRRLASLGKRWTFTSALLVIRGVELSIQETPPSPSRYMMLFLRHTGSLSLYTHFIYPYLQHVCPL